MDLVHLATAYTLLPCLILMCGLPGTGKSHTARAIARPFEAAVLRSDVVRKSIAPNAAAGPVDRLDAGRYAPEVTERTYAALRDQALTLVARGRTVVVDATFLHAALRRPFLRAAEAAGVPIFLVETTCPDAVVRERLSRRGRDPGEASEADWAVYLHAQAGFEPPEEVAASQRVRVDSRDAASSITQRVLTRLVESLRPDAS